MAKVFLRKKITDRIALGHPWIFANEIGDEVDRYKEGDIVSVFSSNGSFVGSGYINPSSQIRIRLLSRNVKEEINDLFFRKRIEAAWLLRQKLGYTQWGRMVFSEADWLPGLIVDRFGEQLVFQTLTLGMDLWKSSLIKSLSEIFKTAKIYEKNDAPVRLLENLPLKKGFVNEPFLNPIALELNNLKFNIDIENSNKTGFYWEQVSIQKALQPLVNNAAVLDVFCHTGFCSLQAARYGAKKVTAIDNDPAALALAKENAGQNGLSELCDFYEGNAFDLLKSWSITGQKFDVVILDPPALAHSKKNIAKAISGYKELNLRALKLLKNGGFLLSTCSSFLISEAMMVEILQDAAKDSAHYLRLINKINQPSDHPVLWNVPATNYFKGFVWEVSSKEL